MSQVVKYIMENLPIDFLKYNHNGEEILYPVDTDVEIGFNYNDLIDFDLEQFKEFNSAKGYIKYHRDIRKANDHLDSKVITQEQYDKVIEQIENNYENYKNI